jgi:glycosyltransferase involved in cell wall biosynthesis
MKARIAVCLPTAPFIRGGAEFFADKLVEQLRLQDYETELITIPFKWYPQKAIMRHLSMWRLVDLTESNGRRIDLMIATKFPSYIAYHPNKVTFLLHQFKMVYELWGTEFCDFSGNKTESELQRQIMAIDNATLPESKDIFTLSKTVSARLRKYNDIESEPIYHPSPLAGKIEPGNIGDTLLAISRLDRLKRFDLLLRALAVSKSKPKTIIAGTGPELKNLRHLADELKVSDFVEFTGFVAEEKLIELYHNCGAVWFAPFLEDYGYVALEAMMAAKPVITTSDAGGVTELVEAAAGGLVTGSDPKEIAFAIDRIFADPEQATRLGKAGAKFVADISWDRVIEKLTETVR